MGAFIHSVAVKTDSVEDIIGVIDNVGESAYISKSVGGWAPVFPEEYGEFDLAERVSEQLDTAVVVGVTHDSDDLYFRIYDKGKMVFEYEYTPTFSNNLGVILKGDVATLNKYALEKKDTDYITKLLTSPAGSEDKYVFVEERYADILGILGLPSYLANYSYEYIENSPYQKEFEDAVKKDMPDLVKHISRLG